MCVLLRLLPAFVLLVGIARAEQSVLEVISLKYRGAEQVVPLLQSLLAPGGTVSGLKAQIVIRTTPRNLEELKEVLTRIDTRPRRLIVSVRQDADIAGSNRGAEVSGSVAIGNSAVASSSAASVRPGATIHGERVRAKVYSSEGQRAGRVAQQVQVIEGARAVIRIGKSVPVRTRQWLDTPDGRRLLETTDYREVDQGFVVVPRVIGDEVTLDLSAAADTLEHERTGAGSVQRVQTTVSGHLGEWIEVAGIGDEAVEQNSEILASSRDARREARRVLLKVDEIR